MVYTAKPVRRVFFVIVVALLSLGTVGVSGLVFQEPCSLSEETREASAPCPPTCVQCACCAQPVVPTRLAVDVADSARTPHRPVLATRFSPITPEAVFHVPKSALR